MDMALIKFGGIVFFVLFWAVVWLAIRPRVNALLDRRQHELDQRDAAMADDHRD
jgi:hypothetical protein